LVEQASRQCEKPFELLNRHSWLKAALIGSDLLSLNALNPAKTGSRKSMPTESQYRNISERVYVDENSTMKATK
jgi:hypothetical protein